MCCQLSRVKKLGSNSLNSNSRGNRWNGTACFSQIIRKSIVCRQNEKSWLQLSGIRKVLFLCPFQSDEAATVNCGRFISALRSLNVHHHEARQTTNPRTVASPCHQTTHQCACHSGHHRIFMDSAHIHPTVLTPHPHIFTLSH